MRKPKSISVHLETIEIRHSEVHGDGAFAAHDFKTGMFLGHYAGRRYTAQQALRGVWDNGLTYLFALSDGTLIDGAQGGNATRHLNHACEPNCEAVEEYDADGKLVLRIEATRPVRAGDELFLDYALIIDEAEQPSEYPCRCGSVKCRGTLAAPAGS